MDADLARDRGDRPRRAPRRADRFKSLYAFLIAPIWWIALRQRRVRRDQVREHDRDGARRDPDLPARPHAGVEARPPRSRRWRSLCTSAFFYAGFLLPEVLAYPMFALCAWVSIRALAGGGRRWITAAVVLNLVATEVRSELVTLPAACALSAAVLWVVGPRGQRLRRGWSVLDHIAAALVLVGAAARVEPHTRPARLAVAHGHDVVARAHVVARDAGHRGARARPRTVPAGLRAGLALDPRAPPRPLLAGVRRLHGCRDRHRLDVHRGEGGVPLDRVRDPRRGAQPDLPRPAVPRRHGRLALLASALAPGDARRLGVHDLARPLLRLPARLSVLRSPRLRHRHAGEPLMALGPADDPHRPRGRERPAAPRAARHPRASRAHAGTNGDHRGHGGGGRHVDARRRDHERERIGERLEGLRRRARETARLGRPCDRTCTDDVHRPEHLVGRRTGDRHARVLEPVAEEHLVARRYGAGPGRDGDARPGEQVRDADERSRLRLRPHDERRGPRRGRSSRIGRA